MKLYICPSNCFWFSIKYDFIFILHFLFKYAIRKICRYYKTSNEYIKWGKGWIPEYVSRNWEWCILKNYAQFKIRLSIFCVCLMRVSSTRKRFIKKCRIVSFHDSSLFYVTIQQANAFFITFTLDVARSMVIFFNHIFF